MHTGMDSVYNFLQGHGSLKPSWRMESQPYITPAGITIVFGAQYSFEKCYLSDNRDGYHERFLVESGRSLGPRIFHTGNIIYGAGSSDVHQDVVNMGEARSALIRIKAEGGPSSFSYKNYQLPSRCALIRFTLLGY